MMHMAHVLIGETLVVPEISFSEAAPLPRVCVPTTYSV